MTSPLVLVSAAMAVHSGFYRPLEEAFREHGWDAETLPTSGFERGAEPASRHHDWSYSSEVAAIAARIREAREQTPGREVILLGHSLGAQLGALHQVHHPPADALVAVGASSPHHRAYPFAGPGVLLLGVSVPVVTRLVGHLPRPFFGAPGARTMMREWARFVRTGRPPMEVPHLVPTPTFVVKLQGDPFAVTAATQAYVDLFCDPALTSRWTYLKSAVPRDGSTDHLAWVKQPQVVVDRVVHWWQDRSTTDSGPQAKASTGGQEQARFRSP